jgi:hypothetical protein
MRSAMKWKRALLLAPLLLGLVAVVGLEPGRRAVGRVISKTIREKIVAALKDPLALFAERSPGARSAGALLSTKHVRPNERVLPTIRDRPSPLGILDTPLQDTPPAVVDIPPGAFVPSPYNLANERVPTPIFTPLFPVPQFEIPPGGGTPSGGPPGTPPGGPPEETPTPPGGTPGTPTPPNQPTPPGGPPVITLPEPATWTVMSLGLLALGMAARRRARKKA